MSANPFWSKMGEIYTVPTVAFEIENSASGSYVQLIFALRYRNLGAIEGVFASLVYFAFQKMEEEWKSLVEDIRHGTICAAAGSQQSRRPGMRVSER
jgi:GH3 auxin-responsive promoter